MSVLRTCFACREKRAYFQFAAGSTICEKCEAAATRANGHEDAPDHWDHGQYDTGQYDDDPNPYHGDYSED